MKKAKINTKVIVFLVILCAVAIWHNFKTVSDETVIFKILSGLFGVFAIVLGSGLLSLAGALILHYSCSFYLWLFDDGKSDEVRTFDDLETYMSALFPVAVAISFYIVVFEQVIVIH